MDITIERHIVLFLVLTFSGDQVMSYGSKGSDRSDKEIGQTVQEDQTVQ